MSTSEQSPCTRFERQGLLLAEQGEQLGEHYQDCEDCIEAARAYRVLKNMIASQQHASSPKEDWQNNVLEEISNYKSSKPLPELGKQNTARPWIGAIAAGIAAVGIATVFLADSVFQSATNNDFVTSELEQSIESSGQYYRGKSAKIGDTLRLRNALPTQLDNSNDLVLRLYRDGIEYFNCGKIDKCAITNQVLEQTIALNTYGEYQAIIFLPSSGSTPAKTVESNGLNADVMQAMDSKQKIIIGEPVLVR